MHPIFEESYFLSAGETNAEQEMSLPILTSKLIDIATAHANSLGIGNPSMREMHAGWVLSRLTIDMESYPKVNDTYTISTWIETFNRHFSERAFKIASPDGKVYGFARSVWMVMDTVSHTNVGLAHFSLPDEMISGEKPPVEKQSRHLPIALPEDYDSSKPGMMATHPPFPYTFKYCDLDSYRHVNTVRYVILLMNRYTLEEHDNTFVKRMELSFLREAKYGMQTILLRADAEGNPGHSSYLLENAADRQPLLFARVIRRERSEGGR